MTCLRKETARGMTPSAPSEHEFGLFRTVVFRILQQVASLVMITRAAGVVWWGKPTQVWNRFGRIAWNIRKRAINRIDTSDIIIPI